MLLPTSLLVVVSFALSSADIPTIGPCSINVETQADFDFDKFHTEKGGDWEGVYGPETEFNKNLQHFGIKITPAGNNQYRDVISYTTKDGKGGILADEIITNDGNGVVTATTTDGHVFEVNFLKYIPGRYAYYYVCSKEGSDTSVDYRYVLTHYTLTSSEKDEIFSLDKKYGFKGKLISIKGKIYD